jgi:S-adenosylmethionine synthetase
MIRLAEAVLPGHPDKFCDQVADALVAEAIKADPAAFAQVEVGVWSDQVWLSGNIVTRKPLARAPAEVLVEVGLSLGFDETNWIDAKRYKITDTLCRNIDDPTEGRGICDDQSIVVGYAGYDQKTRFLPPEQFFVHAFREALWDSCRNGLLKGAGPDGKLIVCMREEGDSWHLEKVLVTLQHREETGLMDLTSKVLATLATGYSQIQKDDSRWRTDWKEVAVLVNPNGPYFRAGSDGDNGQTGRKLVMDYYGPRVPIGGGALSGKHPAHIDRLASYAARQAAIHAVKTGARECLIRLAYAPNSNGPLEMVWEMDGRGERQPRAHFDFDAMLSRVDAKAISALLGQGTHFWDEALPWNQ